MTSSVQKEVKTRATFETLKYLQRPRDQYRAPNSKYIELLDNLSAPPTHTHTQIKKTRRSEYDNTTHPLDQWTNNPFMGQ